MQYPLLVSTVDANSLGLGGRHRSEAVGVSPLKHAAPEPKKLGGSNNHEQQLSRSRMGPG